VAAGVRFTGPIKLISDRVNPDAPGTRVLDLWRPRGARQRSTTRTACTVRDYYDPEVVDAGEADERVESNSAEANAPE
jgi:hypothetical protein